MADKSFVKVTPGERVDQPDLQHGLENSQRGVGQDILENLVLGSKDANQDGLRVLAGWEVSDDTLNITITKGLAITGLNFDGDTEYACITSGGPTQRVINASVLPNAGPYTVWVRFEQLDEEFANRLFWDAALVTPAEVTRNVATRRAGNWSALIALASPGPEWLAIATFTLAGGLVTGLTNTRDFAFEGRSANQFELDDSDWGSADDRSDSRVIAGTTGILDTMRKHARQIQDIIGEQQELALTAPGKGVWKEIVKGLADMLPFDGSRFITGTLAPTVGAHDTIDLGILNTQRWRALYVTSAFINGLAQANRLFLTNTALTSVDTPDANTLYKGLIPKARAIIAFNGTATPTLVDSINVSGVSSVPTTLPTTVENAIRFTFNRPFTGTPADHVSVQISDITSGAAGGAAWDGSVGTGKMTNIDAAGGFADINFFETFKPAAGSDSFRELDTDLVTGARLAIDFFGRQ